MSFVDTLPTRLTNISHYGYTAVMQLKAYLAAKGITLGQFARLVGAKNARTIQRYVKGARTPSAAMMAKIVEQTEGQVMPNDFLVTTDN